MNTRTLEAFFLTVGNGPDLLLPHQNLFPGQQFFPESMGTSTSTMRRELRRFINRFELDWLFNTVVSQGNAYTFSPKLDANEDVTLIIVICTREKDKVSQPLSENNQYLYYVVANMVGPARADWPNAAGLVSYISRCFVQPVTRPWPESAEACVTHREANISEMSALERKTGRCIFCTATSPGCVPNQIDTIWCVSCFRNCFDLRRKYREITKFIILEAFMRPSVAWFSIRRCEYKSALLMCAMVCKYSTTVIIVNHIKKFIAFQSFAKKEAIPKISSLGYYPRRATREEMRTVHEMHNVSDINDRWGGAHTPVCDFLMPEAYTRHKNGFTRFLIKQLTGD